MQQRINRLEFIKKIWVGISAAFLSACKPDPEPLLSATATMIPTKTDTPQPLRTATSSPTPQLPEYCTIMEDAESFLFGIDATRVEEIEPGVYKVVIDKNINPGVLYGSIEYVLLADLDQERTYQVVWLDAENEVLNEYDVLFNPIEEQISCEITGLRKDDFGTMAAVLLLSDDEAQLCLLHPDFNGQIVNVNSKSLLIIQPTVKFEPELVKSRAGSGSSGGTGSGSDGTTGGGPGVSAVSGTGGDS